MYKLESSADYYLGRQLWGVLTPQLLTFKIKSEIFIKTKINDCFINFDRMHNAHVYWLCLISGSISCFGFSLGLLANLTVLSHLLSKSWQRSKMRGSSFARASMPSHYSHVITTRDLLLVMLAITDMITTLVHIISGITLLRTDTGLLMKLINFEFQLGPDPNLKLILLKY